MATDPDRAQARALPFSGLLDMSPHHVPEQPGVEYDVLAVLCVEISAGTESRSRSAGTGAV